MTITLGYDAGGAHLKVARLENGRVTAVRQFASPLWQGLDRLGLALDEARELTAGAQRHAITMTGELTEIFPSRDAGTETLIKFFAERFGDGALFYMGLKGFAPADAALGDKGAVASANFLSTARAIAGKRANALLIDMGSTTTDIIPCSRPQGLTDAERFQTGELVYTGLTRTPVPCVATRAPLLGSWQSLARDTFATMADVRRILGELPEDIDLHQTSDGRGKSLSESLVRFARGFGRDGELRHLAGWQAAAAYIREVQIRSIVDGAMQVLSRPGLDSSGGVISAGVGAAIAAEVAHRLGLECLTFARLLETPRELERAVTHHAPAVAVAMLADAAA